MDWCKNAWAQYSKCTRESKKARGVSVPDIIAFPTELFMASGASWPRINMKIGSQPLLGVAFASFFMPRLALVIVIQLVTIIIYLLD